MNFAKIRISQTFRDDEGSQFVKTSNTTATAVKTDKHVVADTQHTFSAIEEVYALN